MRRINWSRMRPQSRGRARPSKRSLLVPALVGHFLLGYVTPEAVRVADNVPGPKPVISSPMPDPDQLNLTSALPIILEGEIVGRVIIYDEVATPWPADYVELYDDGDRLFGFQWLDRFGIKRTAIDQGLLNGSAELEEIYVVLTDGDPI